MSAINSIDRFSLWAEVILPLALPKVYTYAIPDDLKEAAKPGCRVEVVFGRNKKYAGIISALVTAQPPYVTKPVLRVLDDSPLLYEGQLRLWKWISEYYLCSEGEVMAAALPANFKLSSETILIYNEEAGDDFSGLSQEEYMVAEALLLKKELALPEVQQILDASHVYPVIKKLLDKNVCFAWEKLQPRYVEKKEHYVTLHPDMRDEERLGLALNEWKGAPKQMELLLAFIHLSREGDVSRPDLLKKARATAAQLKGLEDKNMLVVEKRRVDRIPSLPRKVDVNLNLSPGQQSALDQLRASLNDKDTVLLHGVTGSGKTLLYIRLMADYFSAGKQVLYLLPEIALTSQIIRRLQNHFGGHIAIYHSKFNNQERVELWNKIRSGEVRMVLGPRSALLLPFSDLGLIIVDEEHDSSYKQQEPAPRYHARDTAIYYASLFNAKVILGSATPSVESYFNASSGKYGLVKMPDRYGGLLLPEIEIVNTAAMAGKGKVMISEPLQAAIEKTVQNGRQVILFQNRRGYNPYLICGQCGHIPHCDHCDVSLTLHKYSNKLHCHYCGSSYSKPSACVACGSAKWLEKNFGTEKIEENLEALFPKFRVARMDVDSVRGKQAHENLIKLFENHRIDILVGTQMVVKGLDFEKVDLVGILDADGLLSFADFRANERAFQLMEQVSGRSGRKHSRGKVMIQALQVKHPILDLLTRHDYDSFFVAELNERREFGYPPFSRLIKITLKHKDRNKVSQAAAALATLFQQDLSGLVTGPAEPVIARIRNQYLMEFLIKLPKDHRLPALKKVIVNHIQLLHSDKRFGSVTVITDTDPV